jgi:hypothetical protein
MAETKKIDLKASSIASQFLFLCVIIPAQIEIFQLNGNVSYSIQFNSIQFIYSFHGSI